MEDLNRSRNVGTNLKQSFCFPKTLAPMRVAKITHINHITLKYCMEKDFYGNHLLLL